MRRVGHRVVLALASVMTAVILWGNFAQLSQIVRRLAG